MSYIIIAIIVVFVLYKLIYRRFQKKRAVWIYANRMAFACKYAHDQKIDMDSNDTNQNSWKTLLSLLPAEISHSIDKSTIDYKLLAKFVVIKKMFDSGNMEILTPPFVANNYVLFLQCAFVEKSLVGHILKESDIVTTKDQALVFCSALDQIDQAVNDNFPSAMQSNMNWNPDEIILPILFPILEKHFPAQVVKELNRDKILLYGIAYYSYLFLLHKWDFLTKTDAKFKQASLKEKQRHLIFDRGAGNDTAYSNEEIKKITSIKVENVDEAILAIIYHEQVNSEAVFDKSEQEVSWSKFLSIKPDLRRAYLEKMNLKTIE